MKKLTIIPDDNMVVVDGEGLVIDVTADSVIHAIQWDGVNKEGLIEYKDGRPNEVIGEDKIASYLPLVASHDGVKNKINEDRIKAESDDAVYRALPTTKRKKAFDTELSTGDQLDEILKFIESQPVKSVKMQAVIDKANDIKDRFPKEGS
tara:strand:- start:179 stop:628 length:450 start_codon:yes stop_codon:yes gene_type:complete